MDLSQLTVLDAAVALIVFLAVVRGFRDGAFRSLAWLLFWTLGVIAAFVLTPHVAPHFRDIELFDDYSNSCVVKTMLAFAFVLVVSLLAASLLVPLHAGPANHPRSPLDQFAGIFVSAGKALFLIVVIYAASAPLFADNSPSWVDDALVYETLDRAAMTLSTMVSDDVVRWIEQGLEALAGDCGLAVPNSIDLPTIDLPDLG